MSIPTQLPRRMSRPVRVTAARSGSTADGPGSLTMTLALSRGRAAVLAGLAAPPAVTAVLIPFRASLPNTDAALVLVLVVVAAAAAGHRVSGALAAVLILAVGIAVTEMAVRGRKQQEAAARRAGYLDGISAAASAVAAGTEAGGLLLAGARLAGLR